jgi:hypothetical protein
MEAVLTQAGNTIEVIPDIGTLPLVLNDFQWRSLQENKCKIKIVIVSLDDNNETSLDK